MSTSYAVRIITAPPCEPISLDEAKQYLNVDDDDTAQDDLIDALIIAAREWLEDYTGRSYVQRALEAAFDSYCGGIFDLPRPPLISVDSIAYIDANGQTQTWDVANYQVDAVSVPGRITVAYGGSLPLSYRGDLSSWRVRYQAGYAPQGSPDDALAYRDAVPEQAKLAMKVYLTGAFEGELDTMIKTAEAVARPLRVQVF